MDTVEKIILAGYLKRYPRMGSLVSGHRESVASHIFRTAYISYELARLDSRDPGKYVLEALYHDFDEALTLDHHSLACRFVDCKSDSSDVVHDADYIEAVATAVEAHLEPETWTYTREVRLKISKEIIREITLRGSARRWMKLLERKERADVVDRIRLAGLLKLYPRAGWFTVGVQNPERVADHIFRTMVIADILSKEEGYNREEEVIRAMLHDLPEALTGDHHYLAKRALAINEHRLWDFLGLEDPGSSVVLKDADQLELMATAVEYRSVGVRGLEGWIDYAKGKLRLETSRKIAEELEEIVLGDWYVEYLRKIKGAREAEREAEPTAAAKRA